MVGVRYRGERGSTEIDVTILRTRWKRTVATGGFQYCNNLGVPLTGGTGVPVGVPEKQCFHQRPP